MPNTWRFLHGHLLLYIVGCARRSRLLSGAGRRTVRPSVQGVLRRVCSGRHPGSRERFPVWPDGTTCAGQACAQVGPSSGCTGRHVGAGVGRLGAAPFGDRAWSGWDGSSSAAAGARILIRAPCQGGRVCGARPGLRCAAASLATCAPIIRTRNGQHLVNSPPRPDRKTTDSENHISTKDQKSWSRFYSV